MEEINHTTPNPIPNAPKKETAEDDEKAKRQHDRFVRYALQHRKLFMAFLEKYLPTHVRDLIDLKQAQLCKPSTIDGSLRERIADAVYLIPLKSGNGHALICIEHQSTPRPDMPVRLGVHMLRLSEAYRKSNQGKKSLMVFGLLYYNGEKPYNQPTDLFASLNEPERHVSHQTFGSLHLVDTHTIRVRDDQNNLMLHVFELATKHIFDAHVESTLEKLWPHLRALETGEPDGQDFFTATCRYVLYMARQEEDWNAILENVRDRLGHKAAEKMMTLGQKLEQKGRQKGLEQGLEQGREEIAVGMLKKGLNLDMIVELTHLSKERLTDLLSQLEHKVGRR